MLTRTTVAVASLMASFFLLNQCRGESALQLVHITFDGPPPQQPGTAVLIQRYDEVGLTFTPIGSVGFVRQGGAVSGYPENGTTYLQAGLGSTLSFRFMNGSIFNLISVDLAEYSTVVPDAVTVRFVGYRLDGGVVTTDLTTDGIIDGTGPLADFETFYFDSRFTDLTRVEIPTYGWSLDNVGVIPIPEPATYTLLLLGGLLFWALHRSRR